MWYEIILTLRITFATLADVLGECTINSNVAIQYVDYIIEPAVNNNTSKEITHFGSITI